MPSFAEIPDEDRKMLARYISSLKVRDWYLEESKKSAYEKLTGKEYQ
jgi:sulfur-oxidizing protein SoxX